MNIIYKGVFNIKKHKTYFVLEKKFEKFIKDYFFDKSLIYNRPDFYYFLVPFPAIETIEVIKDNNNYDLAIGKFDGLSSFSFFSKREIYFEESSKKFLFGNSTPLFVKDFLTALNLGKKYLTFFAPFLLLNEKQIDIIRLIKPVFKINLNDFQKISVIAEEKLSDLYEEAEKQRINEEYDQYQKYNDSLNE